MLLQSLFIAILASYGAGALGSLLSLKSQSRSHFVSSAFASIGAITGIIFSLSFFLSKLNVTISIPSGLPFFTIGLHIDSLSTFFILIISVIGLLSSIYGFDYMKHYKGYNLGVFGFFYNLFLLSMVLVATASNGFYFIFVWELMSLASLFLVLFENKESATLRAGFVYFVMTHVGTAFISIAFFLIFLFTRSLDFSIIQAQAGLIPPLIRDIIFVCFLIGFGTKAGIIPVHIWLPRAHGAAPSHVSALMSGVMIKMGIFMLIRVCFDLLQQPQLWWGVVILLMGASSSMLGVLYALAEHDIKRLLAYHSIENIGIILMGVGSSMIFSSLGMNEFVALALAAALFHTMNHAVFKSLLFLGAGSVIAKTHTRNMEEYGGLIKKMPYTALFFLIGAIAISGLPPFNGFASEWITYQSLFAGIGHQSAVIQSVFIIAISSLAFTGGLAAACFVKAFGTTFLARPRSTEAEKARESDTSATFSMGALALLCLVLGLGSAFITTHLTSVAQTLAVVSETKKILVTTAGGIHIGTNTTVLNLPLVFAGLLIAGIAAFGFTYATSRQQKTVKDITWNCGFEYTTGRMEITSTGFARSLILIFRGIFRPSKQSTVEYIDANTHNPYLTKSKKVMLSTLNVYEKYMYLPVDSYAKRVSEKFALTQNGVINTYLLYIFITLIGLLIWVRYS